MLARQWDFAVLGTTFVYWRSGRTVWVAERHHRANAALEIGRESGDWSYLHRLLQHGKCEPGVPPQGNRGTFPTRGLWSYFLTLLGW
jgi:hypothetical protein